VSTVARHAGQGRSSQGLKEQEPIDCRPPARAGAQAVARARRTSSPVSRMNQGRAGLEASRPAARQRLMVASVSPSLGFACLRRASSWAARQLEADRAPITKSPQSAVSLAIAAAPLAVSRGRDGQRGQLQTGPGQSRSWAAIAGQS